MENNRFLPEVEVKNLPSKKLQYPEATKIYYNPYTLGDLQVINNSNMNAVQLYEYILRGIRVTGMEKYDLTFYDVVYLGWLRKIASLGTPMFQLQAFCPNCDKKVAKTLELKEMDFQDVSIDKMPINVKIRDEKVSFKFITIKDYLEILEMDKIKDLIYVDSRHVCNMEQEDAYNLLFSLVGEEIDKLEYINKLLYHGLAKVPFTCDNPKCKFEYLVDPANYTEAEITRPFRRQEHDIRNEISFG